MNKKTFGIFNTGAEVYEYTLRTDEAELAVITFGAIIRKFTVCGTDIVGGYDSLEDYIADDSHQGAIIGRVANRIGGARFVMDGKEYRLPKNDGENCLHGGEGFDRHLWQVREATDTSLTLTYHSEDGEEGFPAALDVTVRYSLSGTALTIDYEAVPDGKTPVALTNHAYFNLNGLGGDVLSHTAQLFADRYTEVDGALIPTGVCPSVGGTVFDFRTPHTIGERVGGDFVGYDHNYHLTGEERVTIGGKTLSVAAKVCGERLAMTVLTDRPCIQFYIGNFLGGKPDFKGGVKRIRHGAFCLEAQTEPNCVNRGEGFYEAGEKYTQTTVYEVEKIV